MSNRVSVAIIAGLSVICIGLLLNNSQKSEALKLSANSSTKSTATAPEEVSGTLAEKIGALGGVSVSSFDQKNFFANEYVTTFRIVQRNNNKDVAYRRLNESRDKVLALLKSHSVDEKEYEFLSSTLQKKWSYVESKRKYMGYEAAQEAMVVFHGKSSADSLELDLAGFSFIDNVRTRARLKDADSLEVLVIQNACKKASALANEYAHSVGSEVGKVLSVEGSSDVEEMSSSDSVEVQAFVSATLSLENAENGGRPFVRVTQSENKKFLADKFVISLSLSFEGADKESLFKQIGQKRSDIAQIARDLGVAESEFNAESVNQRKKTDWEISYDGQKKPYKVSQRISVNFVSKDAAAAFMDALVGVENANVLGAAPVLKNEDSLRVQVTNIAGKKAMARAKAIAEGFGGTLGKVVSVSNMPEYEFGRTMLGGGAKFGNGGLRRTMGKSSFVSEIMNSPSEPSMNIADSVAISVYLDVSAEIK